MDLLRLLVPNTIALVIEVLEIMVLATLGAHFGLGVVIVAAPFVLLAGGVVATVVTVAMKWTLIGRYRRSEHPLWCSFVWRDEMMNAAQEQLAMSACCVSRSARRSCRCTCGRWARRSVEACGVRRPRSPSTT